MFVRNKNFLDIKDTNHLKKITSVFTYDQFYNSKLDTLYYNKLKNKFERLSYFLKRFDDRFALRDVIYSDIDYKYGIINQIKSSFNDSPTVYGKQKSDILNYVNNNFTDINHSFDDQNISINDISYMNKKKMNISDNNKILSFYDYLVESSDLDDLELFIFEALLVTFSLPLIHIPIYLSAIFDWDIGKLQIKELRILSNDLEMKNYLKLLIYKINILLEFLYKIIRESLYINKKSYLFMININFFELNLNIFDKDKKIEYLFIFNSNDYYRLLRILSSSISNNENKSNLYKDFIKLATQFDINTIANSIKLVDSVEYLLEYFNFHSNERREYQEVYN